MQHYCGPQVDLTFHLFGLFVLLNPLHLFLNKVFKKFQQTVNGSAHICIFIIWVRKTSTQVYSAWLRREYEYKRLPGGFQPPLRLSKGTYMLSAGYHAFSVYF